MPFEKIQHKFHSPLAFSSSPEYTTVVADDCKYFIALPTTYMVGYENLFTDSAIKELGGKDGLQSEVTAESS